jgi:hypothetical protein
MALIYDGIRVFNPAVGGSILAADHEDFQNQMILGMEERTFGISMTSFVGDTPGVAGSWAYNFYNSVDPPYWQFGAGNPGGETLEHEFCYAGSETRLTEISVIIDSDSSAGDGGDISLWEKRRTTTLNALNLVTAIDATDPWVCNGGAGGALGTPLKLTATGLSDDLDASDSYYLVCEAPTIAAARTCRVYSAEYKAWFHKGS